MLSQSSEPSLDQSKPDDFYAPAACQVIACVNQVIGGPALSVTNLAESLNHYRIRSHLWTLHYPNLGQQLRPEQVQMHSYQATFLTRYCRGFHPTGYRALQDLAVRELDLIHNHGVWMFPNFYARQAAQVNNIPLIISPRGMLEAWSLQYGQFRKRIAWHLYESNNLKHATLFHATSEMEAHSIRQLGFQQPIAVIPNGVSIPTLDSVPSREVLTQKFPALTNQRWLLFLSRLHPKKGLDTLLKVWKTLEAQFSDWHLVLAGPDLIGYQSTLVELVESLNLQHRVTFTGMLSGDEKASALGNADLFVLPSHSENFGIAIAESLAYEVPVITTQGTPWQELTTHNCGWWIQNTPETLEATLIEAMQMPEQQRRSMGMNGRKFVADRYSWSAIAQAMSDVYHWLLQGGTPPAQLFED